MHPFLFSIEYRWPDFRIPSAILHLRFTVILP